MSLIFATLVLAALLGLLLGGRLSELARLHVRWAPAAAIGLALQLAPVSGNRWPLVLLYVSFAILTAFAIANIRGRVPGSWLILIGIWLNFVVIAVNQGMPVARDALVRSGQMDTLEVLVDDGGAKHHLAGPDDTLSFLGDVIAIGAPVHQAVSVGDVFTYAGVGWLVVGGMRGTRRPKEDEPDRGHAARGRTLEVASDVG
jgi:Family of unknown function (DUF5317)